MSFFEKTKGFDLYQYFDPNHPDVRIQLGAMPTEGEAPVRALDDLLEKRDPMRKAERAERRRDRKLSATSSPKAVAENDSVETQGSSSDNPTDPSALKKMGSVAIPSVPKSHALEPNRPLSTALPWRIARAL